MNAITYLTSSRTLFELNGRLRDKQLQEEDFCIVGPAIQDCLGTFPDISHSALFCLERQMTPLWPCITKEAEKVRRIFFLRVRAAILYVGKIIPPLCALPLDEALVSLQNSVRGLPQVRLQQAMGRVEPIPKNHQETAEKFQTILSVMLMEGRLLRLAAIACGIARRIQNLRPQVDAPIAYPEQVKSEREMAFWLQLPSLLAQIGKPQMRTEDFLTIHHYLNKHGFYKQAALKALELHLSTSQLRCKKEAIDEFLDQALPSSLLLQERGRYMAVLEVVAPFGAFFIQLRRKQRKPEHYTKWKKIFDAFKNARQQQRILFDYTSGQFTLFLSQRLISCELLRHDAWTYYKRDAGPQGTNEKFTQYCTYDPEPAPSAVEFLLSHRAEEEKEPLAQPNLGKDFPFQYEQGPLRGISRQADRFYDCGLKFEFATCTLFVIPAKIENQYGTIVYGVKDNVCFQRTFHPRALSFLFEKFSKKSFVVEDFPELAATLVAAESDEKVVIDHDFGIVRIGSLTLFLLQRK